VWHRIQPSNRKEYYNVVEETIQFEFFEVGGSPVQKICDSIGCLKRWNLEMSVSLNFIVVISRRICDTLKVFQVKVNNVVNLRGIELG